MKLDLDTYAARIGYRGPLTPTLDTLRELHLAHVTHISFENLDVLLRRPIRLDLDSLWAKLVLGGRGGYCFEQNGLFAAVLETIGFRVIRMQARTRMGSTRPRPRTHMCLGVELTGERWLCDVGYGADGLMMPLALRLERETRQLHWTYRVVSQGLLHVLQTFHPEGWFDLYSFTLEEVHPIDYEVANYFISTHPMSPFVHSLIAQRSTPDSRFKLLNRQLTERRPEGGDLITIVADDAALLALLDQRFELRFAPGTRFPYVEGNGGPIEFGAASVPGSGGSNA